MSEKVFFTPVFSWDKSHVWQSTASNMNIIIQKPNEEAYQQSEWSFETLGPASRSVAVFICRNIDDLGQVMKMTVMMQ